MKSALYVSLSLAVILWFVGGSNAEQVASDNDDKRTKKMNEAIRLLQLGYQQLEEEARALLGGDFSSEEVNRILRQAAEVREKDHQEDLQEEEEEEEEPGERLLEGGPPMADRHIRDFLKVVEDPECMEWEYDLRDPDFYVEEASETLAKCRLLVIRNLFDAEFIQDYKKQVSDFLVGLHTRGVNRTGTTTNPSYGGGFMEERQKGRWEILLPRHLAHPKLLLNPTVLDLISNDDNRILGPNRIVDGLGVVTANPGSGYQAWHHDDDYLFGDEQALHTIGIAGHDLPPTQISLFTPVTNVTRDMGPTEMCVGSSYLNGMRWFPPVKNPTLTDEDSLYHDYADNEGCPDDMWRSPLLNVGDAVFWDNQLWHRGGSNNSPNLRTMLFVTYSRHWKLDGNVYENREMEAIYDEERKRGGVSSEDEAVRVMTKTTPFAVPDGYDTDKGVEQSCNTDDGDHRCQEMELIDSIGSLFDGVSG